MQQNFYLKRDQLSSVLSEISKSHALFCPQKKDDDYVYLPWAQIQSEEAIYNEYRGVEPIKSFLTHSKEIVNEYFNSPDAPAEAKPLAVFGVKNCDLSSLTLQDYVFEQGVEVDPIYKKRRENLLIISSDCTGFKPTCFCLAVGNKPYPEKNFDINLSPINNGFVVEVGSSKGETLIRKLNQYFTAATTGQIAGSKIKRDNIVNDLNRHLATVNIPPANALQKNIQEGYDSNVWKEQMLTCVECGACNFICPSCHCFLLADEEKQGRSERIRVWDSCLYANYSKVAGGANPLNTRAKRLRNRFVKKFDFFPDNLGQFGCTGCGRCIEACPAKIDIREVLKSLAKK